MIKDGPSFQTIRQVEEYLNTIPRFGITGAGAANFNLGRMIRFCKKIGNPENKFPSIHVAGTNGKGTTCQMLASVYQCAGYKTGLYTSPHLLDVRERFRINGLEIDDQSLLSFFGENKRLINEEKLTFFELTTVIAFWYFSREKVDLAILETGLGGRLDATNVVNPMVSVITSVGMDHADILGDTLAEIAREKGGIIKPGKPVVTGRLQPEALDVIRKMAEMNHSDVYEAETVRPRFENEKIILSGTGRYAGENIEIRASLRKRIDALNAAITLLTIDTAYERFPVHATSFIEGIEQLDYIFPHHAHFEKLNDDVQWYFDGAHNIEATEILTDELISRAPADQWTVVLSFMDDKLNDRIAELWNQFPDIRYYVQSGGRAASSQRMQHYFPKAIEIKEFDRIFKGNPEQSKSELVIFSGSFYFYEKVRRWMGTTATK